MKSKVQAQNPMIFSKYHGTGNDFILVDGIKQAGEPSWWRRETLARLCDRHFGIGADGVIVLLKSEAGKYRMKYFNSDGLEASMCGNGLRCLALFIRDHGYPVSTPLPIDTASGEVAAEIFPGNRVRISMPAVSFDRKSLSMPGKGECIDEELRVEGAVLRITACSVGNPHVVIFGKYSEDQVRTLGPLIENHESFPRGINVHFVRIESPDKINQKIWERGSGATLACGSGAIAAVAAGIVRGQLPHGANIRVAQPGGELIVAVAEEFKASSLEGEATLVFQGEINL